MAQTQPPLGQEGKGRHVQTQACGRWYCEASSWGGETSPPGRGQRGCTKPMLVDPVLGHPQGAIGVPRPSPSTDPHHKTQSPGCHSRFIVSDRAPAKLSQGPRQWPQGSRWRGGQEPRDAEVKAWSPGLPGAPPGCSLPPLWVQGASVLPGPGHPMGGFWLGLPWAGERVPGKSGLVPAMVQGPRGAARLHRRAGARQVP